MQAKHGHLQSTLFFSLLQGPIPIERDGDVSNEDSTQDANHECTVGGEMGESQQVCCGSSDGRSSIQFFGKEQWVPIEDDVPNASTESGGHESAQDGHECGVVCFQGDLGSNDRERSESDGIQEHVRFLGGSDGREHPVDDPRHCGGDERKDEVFLVSDPEHRCVSEEQIANGASSHCGDGCDGEASYDVEPFVHGLHGSCECEGCGTEVVELLQDGAGVEHGSDPSDQVPCLVPPLLLLPPFSLPPAPSTVHSLDRASLSSARHGMHHPDATVSSLSSPLLPAVPFALGNGGGTTGLPVSVPGTTGRGHGFHWVAPTGLNRKGGEVGVGPPLPPAPCRFAVGWVGEAITCRLAVLSTRAWSRWA